MQRASIDAPCGAAVACPSASSPNRQAIAQGRPVEAAYLLRLKLVCFFILKFEAMGTAKHLTFQRPLFFRGSSTSNAGSHAERANGRRHICWQDSKWEDAHFLVAAPVAASESWLRTIVPNPSLVVGRQQHHL
jgi:hypothetical protein